MRATIGIAGLVVALVLIFAAIGIFHGDPVDPGAAAIDARQATQIVVQWPDSDVGLLRIWWMEHQLDKYGAGKYLVDGDDFGAGTANIFLFANDPDSAVRHIIELHDQGRLRGGMRIGVAQNYNSDRTDWTYKAAFPPGLQTFDVFGRTGTGH